MLTTLCDPLANLCPRTPTPTLSCIGYQGVASTTPVVIKGEAYKIERDIKFPQEGLNGVDFSLVRVVDSAVKPVTIKNTGKYQISYTFSSRGPATKDVFAVIPESGTIDPGKEATVQVQGGGGGGGYRLLAQAARWLVLGGGLCNKCGERGGGSVGCAVVGAGWQRGAER